MPIPNSSKQRRRAFVDLTGFGCIGAFLFIASSPFIIGWFFQGRYSYKGQKRGEPPPPIADPNPTKEDDVTS